MLKAEYFLILVHSYYREAVFSQLPVAMWEKNATI